MLRQRNNKHKKSILRLATTVVLSSLLALLPLFSVFMQKNDVYADGVSKPDVILLEAIKNGLKKCISNGFLKKTEIPNSNDLKETNLFNNTVNFRLDNYVALPYQYGTGNTLKDGGVSCSQLFTKYTSDGTSNSFDTYKQLGGSGAPFGGDDPVERKNAFLEALGYVSNGGGNKHMTCGQLHYSVVKGSVTTKNSTNTICVNTDAQGNIVSPRGAGKNLTRDDFSIGSDGSNQHLKLDFVGGAITLMVDTSIAVGNNCTLSPKKVHSSMKIKDANPRLDANSRLDANARINATPRITAKELFENFFDGIPGNLSDVHSEVTSSANDLDVGAAPAPHGGCIAKTLKSELNADSILLSNSESRYSVEDKKDNELSNALGKSYTYPDPQDADHTNYEELMKVLVPNYSAPDESTTKLAKAYNWFYLLNDVFKGISVDQSIKCPTTQPSNGIYLKYYNRSDDNPEVFEEEYCVLDEAVLDQKSSTVIMSDSEAGKAYGALNTGSGVDIGLLTSKTVLNNLNSLVLPDLCAQDGSFPLCRANPSECQEDPTKEDCRNANNASETGEDGQNGEQAVCMQNAGALGWIICPLMYGIRDAANGLFEKAVTPLLRVHESVLTGLNSNSNSPMYQAWSFFRNVANIMFVIAMLFVIFSQITGFGIDNYGIKKILPKLIVTAIIVNFSYIICGIFVDLSNIFGEGIKNIFESVAGSTTATTEKLGENVAALINEVVGMIATVAAAGGAAALGLTAVNAVTSGSLLTIIFPILAFIGSALMAAFFAMLMLGLRQALIIIMIVVSPVAFVLYAIPNTNGLFKKWFQLFKTLLMLFPVFCFMVGGGFLVSNIIIKADSDIFMKIIGGLISIAPYFAVPSMTKNAMKGFDGAVAGLGTLQQKANNAGTSINKKITNSDAMKDSMQNAQIGKMQRYVDKYSDKDVSKLASWKKRRLSNAVGFLNKDGRKNAAVGAAMREYAYNNSQENVDRINAAEINALNDTVKSDLMSSYKSENLSNLDALKQLKDAQGYDYSTGTVEANRDNDNRIRALSSYLASTKEGQKALDQYMSGGYLKKDASGNIIESESVRMGDSSKRAMAVMGRNMVDNHANLRDKYQVAFDQFDNMRGSQKIEDMTSAADGQAVTNQTLSSGLNASLSNVAGRMDLDDLNKLGKQDFKKFYNTSGAPTFGATDSEFTKLQGLADARIKQLRSDTTLISGLSDEEKKFLSLYSTGNVDASTISNVLYMKDTSGTVTGTIEQS